MTYFKYMKIVKNFSKQRVSVSRISAMFGNDFVFGNIISEHMLIVRYVNGVWGNPVIQPYAPIELFPATSALHYGQSVFEGMKAFHMANGNISIFRMRDHFERFNQSLARMQMPQIPELIFMEGIKTLIDADKDWVPLTEGSSLYVRPFMFASDNRFGVRPSSEYTFIIFSGPVPAYFSKPLKVKVERKYSRAVEGGTGFAKCAGNYAGSFYPTALAQNEGYDQVLWTDGLTHENIEESGMMNIFFVINNTLITPITSGTILNGITRNSIIKLADYLQITYEERNVSVNELQSSLINGTLTEAFGTGTAAVTAAINVIGIDNIDYSIQHASEDSDTIRNRLHMHLCKIRTGQEEDIFHWNTVI